MGIRFSSLLLRATVDLGVIGGGSRGYAMAALRGDWVHSIEENTTLVAGIGFGGITYGFIFDKPTADEQVLTPEIGVLFGKDRWFGRVLITLTGFAPLGPVSHPRDYAGQAVSPPHLMVTLLLSL